MSFQAVGPEDLKEEKNYWGNSFGLVFNGTFRTNRLYRATSVQEINPIT